MFQQQVVWITGGGTGLGRALAIEFHKRGAFVVVSGRRQAPLDEVAAEVEGAAVVLDVTDDDAVAQAVSEIVDTHGGIDVVVANAGVSVMGPLASLTKAQWQRQLDINVHGLVSTARYALPHVVERKGRVVLMASVAGLIATENSSAYSASKFAARAIGLCLAQELHGTGASCTVINPGFVESDITFVDNDGKQKADRKDPRPQKLMWPADRAARVMVKAIARRRREFTFTWHGKLGAFLGQHFPGLVHFMMTRGTMKKTTSGFDKGADD